MQTIFEKCPFKENGKLSKLFRLVLRSINLSAGSDTPHTPQNKTLRGIRPRRTKSCGVSDPAEQWQSYVHFMAYTCSTGSDTLQNNVLQGLIPRLKESRGVSDPAEQSPAGYQTPRNNIQKWIFLRIWKRIQKYFRVWIRGLYGVDPWKKPEVKNHVLLSL